MRGVEDEFAGLNDAAPIFPPGPKPIRHIAGDSEDDRKRQVRPPINRHFEPDGETGRFRLWFPLYMGRGGGTAWGSTFSVC